jgi:Flp pilus assembly protein TadG
MNDTQLQETKIEASKYEQGQSLTEFAISLIILLILVSGVVDLGRAFFTVITLNDAVKEGTSYASICPADTSGIQSRLMESASDPVDLAFLDTGDIEVCVSTPGSDTCGAAIQIGNEISVSVSYDHEISTPFLGSIIGTQSLELNASAQDTILRTTCITN